MTKVLLLPTALCALLAAGAFAQTPQTSPAPAAQAGAATPPPAAAPAPPQPFVVYLTDEQDDGSQETATAATPTAAPIRVGDPSPATLVALGAFFLLGAYLWLRLRTPSCPSCATKVSRLTRTQEDASLLAAGGREITGTAPGAIACLACGEVVRSRFLSMMTPDRRCPQCSQPTKKVQLKQLERSGYLTWGVVQIDEDCLSCSYRSSQIYPSPPLEAPLINKGLSRV
ncbi:MAG TPA: hypothetical protein VEG34_04815 [Thermoanaerobaculia bacterium]|nr:hypothetical protein [Thermoanaerobaculia bacterium]